MHVAGFEYAPDDGIIQSKGFIRFGPGLEELHAGAS